MANHHLTGPDGLTRLPGPAGERFVELFRHGTLAVELYAPRGTDPQTPHSRDEVYVVIHGRGQFRNADERHPFGPGDVLFVPAGVTHRFEEFTDDLAVWVFFYGPEGGEVPPMTADPGMGSPLERTLDRESYLSEDFFAREKERIFFREWFCVGREEELSLPGEYAVKTVAGESVLLVRTREGRLAGHYNVCRHRGSQLVPEGGAGTFAGAIRCPYHSWTYTLSGALRTAPFLDESQGLPKSELSLHPVGVESWGGFLFVNLAPADAAARGRTLAVQLGEIAERVRRYPLTELRVARRIVYQVQANWKVMLENYNECYHCGPVHPELCRLVPAFKQRGGAELDWERGIPHREGAWTFTLTGTSARAPFAGLDDDERVRHKGELIYPNFLLSLSADHVAAFTLWPEGPERTTIVNEFLFHPDEIAKPGFDPSDAVEFWDLVNKQDWTICESVQRGMRSRVFQSGYYAPMESASLDIRRYIREHLGAAET